MHERSSCERSDRRKNGMDNLEKMLYHLRLERVAVQARIAGLEKRGLKQNIRVPRAVAAMRSLKKRQSLIVR
jgi:hypothetical protein